MTAATRAALKLQLLRHEGCVLLVYDDATGKPLKPGDTLKGHVTIGTGREACCRGITTAEADALLEHDLDIVADELAEAFPWSTGLDEVRQQVLANMAFNVGLPRLKGFRRMLDAVAVEDFPRAADEMLASKWAGQVGRRATELANMMRTGVVT